MRKIFCPKCDEEITLSVAKLQALKERADERMAIVCPSCTHQLKIRLKAPKSSDAERRQSAEHFGHITVLENVFGYKQVFPLYKGLNHIGRRNKDTQTDIPIVTGDPSMDRHHAIIKVSQTKAGRTLYALSDDDSRVGTFVGGNILGPKEWYNLSEGDVLTLGATTIIFSTSALPDEVLSGVEGEN